MSALQTGTIAAFTSLLFGVIVIGVAGWSHKRMLLLRLHAALGNGSGSAPLLHGPIELLQSLGRHLPGAADQELRKELMRAGYFQRTAAPVFASLRVLLTAGIFLLVLLLKGAAPASLLFAGFAALLFHRLIRIALKMQAETRAKQLRSELPPVVDVLLMVLNSGVSIDQCLRHVTGLLEKTAPLTGAVLKRYVGDIDSGVPFETAFERFGQRLGMDEGHDLAALISQALLQGGEILGPLERFGAELSEKRVAAAREQIGRKSIYLTLTMLGFFMPVLLIVLAGPAVSKITTTLTNVKVELHHKGVKR